jgi:hypothetical protein
MAIDRLRTAAVVGLLGIAATHVFELPGKLEESAARYQGVLFIALMVGCVLLAATVKVVPPRLWWSSALALAVLPFVAYVLSRSVGLPGGGDDIGAWTESSGIASIVFEAFTAALAANALTLLGTRRERAERARPRELAREQS